MSTAPSSSRDTLEKLLRSRIAIIDGAMGTTIRTYGMKEADIRAARFSMANPRSRFFPPARGNRSATSFRRCYSKGRRSSFHRSSR